MFKLHKSLLLLMMPLGLTIGGGVGAYISISLSRPYPRVEGIGQIVFLTTLVTSIVVLSGLLIISIWFFIDKNQAVLAIVMFILWIILAMMFGVRVWYSIVMAAYFLALAPVGTIVGGFLGIFFGLLTSFLFMKNPSD